MLCIPEPFKSRYYITSGVRVKHSASHPKIVNTVLGKVCFPLLGIALFLFLLLKGGTSNKCNPSFTTKTEHRLLYKEINRDSCKRVEAYFDFDRSTGVLLHYCSGLLIEPSGIYVVAKQLKGSTLRTYNPNRWKVTQRKL